MNRASRRSKTNKFIRKQVKIAKSLGITILNPGKLKKKHALDCGKSRCLICGNPRKLWKKIPIQELRRK